MGELNSDSADKKATKIYSCGKMDENACPECTQELWSVSGTDAQLSAQEGGAAGVGVCMVLAAGNKTFLTAVDAIERIFVHKECVFLKNHPIRPFLASPLAHLFAPLIEKGVFAQCLDAEVGQAHAALIGHESVNHVHMTGSGATHDKIVASLEKAKRADKVSITSELGCVTPWILCPGVKNEGKWSKEQIEHHAAMLAKAFKENSSMNCCAPKVLVLPTEELWPQRAEFLSALDKAVERQPSLPPYYPGAHGRYANFEKEYPAAKKIESKGVQDKPLANAVYPGQNLELLPSLLVDCGTIGSSECKKYALENEAFAPVLAIATVESKSATEFPVDAAKACNEKLFGNLTCTVVYPDERDDVLDATIAELNYGVVAVNLWSAFTYADPLCVWGGAPGTWQLKAPNSGLGFVGNASGVPDVVKGVAVSPFVNKQFSKEAALPMIILDSLQVLISGQSKWKIMGTLFGRGFGLLPRRMPKAPVEDRAPSRMEGCMNSFRGKRDN